MEPVLGVAAGALAGAIAADVYDDAKDRVTHGTIGGEAPEHGPIEMQMLVDLVANIEKVIREARGENSAPAISTVSLTTGNPYILNRRHYKHVSLMAAAAFNLVAQTPIGPVTFAMSAGWNPLDLPDHTELTLSTGGPTSVMLWWGEYSLDMAGI